MKRLVLIIALLLPISATADDKLLHATGAYVATNIFMELGMEPRYAFLTTMAIALLKESRDNNTPAEHFKDILAGGLGAGGAALVYTWEIKPKKRAW